MDNNILNTIKKMIMEKATELNLEIISVEWVNEYGTYFLRVIADSEETLTIDQATMLNEAISMELDNLDLISEEYMLEVSSPGIERELKTENDILKNIDQYIHIDFKNHFKITANKSVLDIEGYLRNYVNNVLEIEYNNKGQVKKLLVNKDDIKLIRLAIKF